jgi:manganese transport protein
VTAAEAAVRGQVTLEQIQARGRIRGAAALLGPAFVASVAYVDPGNFATNFAGGAQYGYQLVWVIVMANLMAILVQYLTSKAGLATGRSLPELCRERFGRRANVLLWLQAEVIAMATDLAEFVGAAVGINLLFGVPLFLAGLVTAVVAFIILGLEQRGYRRFELAPPDGTNRTDAAARPVKWGTARTAGGLRRPDDGPVFPGQRRRDTVPVSLAFHAGTPRRPRSSTR